MKSWMKIFALMLMVVIVVLMSGCTSELKLYIEPSEDMKICSGQSKTIKVYADGTDKKITLDARFLIAQGGQETVSISYEGQKINQIFLGTINKGEETAKKQVTILGNTDIRSKSVDVTIGLYSGEELLDSKTIVVTIDKC